MKRILAIAAAACVAVAVRAQAPERVGVVLDESEKVLNSQWAGAKVAFLGDSMTDPRTLGGPQVTLWWGYLKELLGLDSCFVYGISGHQWNRVMGQAEKLYAEHGTDVDAILIFAGTNDYNGGVPLGSFFAYESVEVEVKGPAIATRRHRLPLMGDSTFCSRINTVLSYLKTVYPDKQIVVMGPIHRGYAKFNEKNVQPDEYYANSQDLFLEDYVDTLRRGCAYWSVPFVDLYAEGGIVPNLDSNVPYINRAANDRLHPSTLGQYRIAKVLEYKLLSYPVKW